MRNKLGKWALILGVLLLACGVLVYRVHFRWKWAVEDYKKQLRAAGEKLTVAEQLPRPAPLESNSAWIFNQAVPLNSQQTCIVTNQPPSMHMVAPGKAMIGWAQPDIRGISWATNSWEEVEAALAQNGEALELFHQLIDRPTLDFGLQYQQGLMPPPYPHASMKAAAQWLSAATISDLHRGDAASAVTNLRSALALVKGSGEARPVISQLVRMAIAQIVLQQTGRRYKRPT